MRNSNFRLAKFELLTKNAKLPTRSFKNFQPSFDHFSFDPFTINLVGFTPCCPKLCSEWARGKGTLLASLVVAKTVVFSGLGF